jgi:hypothetical protein
MPRMESPGREWKCSLDCDNAPPCLRCAIFARSMIPFLPMIMRTITHDLDTSNPVIRSYNTKHMCAYLLPTCYMYDKVRHKSQMGSFMLCFTWTKKRQILRDRLEIPRSQGHSVSYKCYHNLREIKECKSGISVNNGFANSSLSSSSRRTNSSNRVDGLATVFVVFIPIAPELKHQTLRINSAQTHTHLHVQRGQGVA